MEGRRRIYDLAVATIDLPDDLIALERAAWEQIQAGRLTVETALAVHEGIARHVWGSSGPSGTRRQMRPEVPVIY